jgi:hypothetical protein
MSSSSSQPNAAYIEDSSSWALLEEVAVDGIARGLIGVAATAVCGTFAKAGGELCIIFAGVSKMCLSIAALAFGFDGVAKIVLRTLSESKTLAFGAFDGVSEMLLCTRIRPVALR